MTPWVLAFLAGMLCMYLIMRRIHAMLYAAIETLHQARIEYLKSCYMEKLSGEGSIINQVDFKG